MKTANKILAFFLSVVILSTLLVPPVFAADPTVEFSSTKTSVNTGDTFVISIKATDTLTGVYSVGPLIRFDNTQLEVTNLKWNSSIPYAFPSTVETANTNGFFTTNYADNTTGAALDISAGDVFVEATFAVKSGASGSTEITTEAEFADEYGAGVAGAVLNQDKITITIVSGITGSLPISITAPAKGATPQSTISDTAQYTGTIVWEGSPATFAPSTVYTAKVELTAKSGYQFAASVNPIVAGADSITEKNVSSGGNKLTFKATFPRTPDKDPATITTPPAAIPLTYDSSEQELVTAGSGVTGGILKYRLGESGTWSTAVPKAVNADEYTVYYMVEGDADHSSTAPVGITVKIERKPITPTITVTGSYTYDGNPITPTFTVKDGVTDLAETDYTAEVTNNTSAGTGTITVKEAANGNYTFTDQTANFTIAKKNHGDETASGSARYGAEGTVDLSSYIAPGGTATYASKTDSDSVLAEDPSLVGNVLKFKFADNSSNVGKNATATINVTSANYTNYAITVTLTVTDKVTPTVTAPTAKALTYNGAEQVLINAGSTTGGELQYSLTSGSGYSTELPKAKDADSYNVYYKVVGDAEYADVAENHITVIINKKAATVAPKSFTITKGDAIPTFELAYTGLVSGDTLTPSTTPTFICFESDGITPVSTSTPAGTYTITWTNKDVTIFTGTDNYNLTATGTATLTIEDPSSGGVSTYAITVKDAQNGAVTASRKSASKGTTVTLTATPDKGYELDTIKVLDSKGNAIKLTEKEGKFTFTMPASKVTVEAGFKAEAPVVKHPFTDVPEDSWYEDAVIWAVDKGVTSGTSATTFDPDGICTRAQAVTFLWRAAGSPAPTTVSMPFTDVKAGSWYYDAVLWAVEQGITKGTSDITFSPDLNCSRGQIVTFLWRSAKSPVAGAANPFTDVKADAYYAHAVLWAVKAGVTNGSSATTFSPDADCSRAQIVTFIYRHMTK